MKYPRIAFCVVLLFISTCCLADYKLYDLFHVAGNKVAEEVSGVLPGDKVIAVLPFENDSELLFTSIIVEKLSDYYKILDKENLELLFQSALLQQDIAFRETIPLGQFQNAEYLLLGSVYKTMEKTFGKDVINLRITYNLNNIETGTILLRRNLTYSEKVNFSLHFFVLPLVLLFLITCLLNYITKGYHALLFFSGTLIIFVTYTIWFFIL